MSNEPHPPPIHVIPLSYSIPAKRQWTIIPPWLAWSVIGFGMLAVITASFVPTRPYRGNARIPAARADIATLSTALDTYQVDMGRYPTTAEGLASLSWPPPGATSWQGPYISNPASKDPWGHPYIYRCPGKHNPGFDLLSVGADGREGTGDDISNWSMGL